MLALTEHRYFWEKAKAFVASRLSLTCRSDSTRLKKFYDIFIYAFVAGLFLGIGIKHFLSEKPRKVLVRRFKRWNHVYPELCESISFLPHLSNWSVHQWSSIDNEDDRWASLGTMFDSIYGPYFQQFAPLAFRDGDIVQYFARYMDEEATCNIVHIGAHGRLGAVTEMLRHRKNCKLLVADRDPSLRQSVEKNGGRFSENIVSGQSGVFPYSSQIRSAHKGHDFDANNYAYRVGILEFLKEFSGDQAVDQLLIDADGEEYSLLQALHDDAAQLPSVCQIGITLRYPTSSQGIGISNVTNTFCNLLGTRRYILLNVQSFDNNRTYHLYMLNIRDEECVEKFVCP